MEKSKHSSRKGSFQNSPCFLYFSLILFLFVSRYLKRENEPRDNELWSGPKPNLHQSTYKILGKQLENDERTRNSLETETRFKHEEALRLKSEEDVANQLDTVKEMIDMQNKGRLDTYLNNYDNLKDSILMHQEGHNKHHLETTYNKDFEHPNPEMINYKDEKMVGFHS